MSIFAIGDLHMSLKVPDKSMDIFGKNWVGHWDKIKESWNSLVAPEDLVLVPGDISWAMHLQDAKVDLDAIGKLPGTKIILRGNHDYWWQSMNKIKSIVGEGMYFLQNNSYEWEGMGICGTRGWNVPGSSDFGEEDEKIFRREVERLKLSLDSYKGEGEKYVMMHYPPYNDKVEPNAMTQLLVERGIRRVIFGHIHGHGLKYLREGEYFGIDFRCVSCDRLDFKLKKIQ